MLRPQDQAWLEDHGYVYSTSEASDGIHLVLLDVALPDGLQPKTVDILVILPPGFNDVNPDMFWCYPAVARPGGATIVGTEARHEEGGRSWQRWSRHIGDAWRPGIDNLATYVAYVKRAITQSAEVAA